MIGNRNNAPIAEDLAYFQYYYLCFIFKYPSFFVQNQIVKKYLKLSPENTNCTFVEIELITTNLDRNVLGWNEQ